MTSPLLSNPHPSCHIVYPYNDELKAINAVFLFASSELSKGESVILIMGRFPLRAIMQRLAAADSTSKLCSPPGRLNA